MDRVLIDSFEIKFKSALRNLKSAILLGAMLFALCFPVEAQQPVKIPRIGWLTGGFLSINTARQQAFREGLRDLGYVEGKNILIEWRGADNKRERRSALAEELVRLKVDVIVTGGSAWNRRCQGSNFNDSDRHGAIWRSCCSTALSRASRRPGGNITGLSRLSPELSGKTTGVAEGDRS